MAIDAGTLTRPHVWRPSSKFATAKTLLLLHGTGADEFDLLGLGRDLDPRANLLAPRGMVRLEGMNRFFVRNDDGTFDELSIIKNIRKLAEFIKAAQAEYGFDLSKLYAVGFSNGANAAGALLLLNPELLAGVVAFGTTKSFVESPAKPNLKGKRVWIANGEMDEYSPEDRTNEMIAEFTSLGAQVKLLMHPGGHTISMEHIMQICSELA